MNSLQRYKDRWPACGDSYALKYTPLHFIQALAGGPEREDLAAHLATLLFDVDFACRKADLFGVDALTADLTLALRRNCIPEEATASDLTALKETLDLEALNFRGWNSQDYKSHFLTDLYNRAAATGRRMLRSRYFTCFNPRP